MTERGFLNILNGGICCSLLLFVYGVNALFSAYHRDRSTRWPTATGVVAATALQMDFHKPPHAPYYKPFVCYTYHVGDGIPRANTTINYSDSPQRFHQEEGLAWLKQNYPIGKQISVFYDPDAPDLSVLERGAKDLIFIALAVTGTSFTCGVGLWALARQARRRLSAADSSEPLRSSKFRTR